MGEFEQVVERLLSDGEFEQMVERFAGMRNLKSWLKCAGMGSLCGWLKGSVGTGQFKLLVEG